MSNINKTHRVNSFSDGLKDAWMDGIIDSLPDGFTDEDLAREVSLQVGRDYSKYKSMDGLIRKVRSNDKLMEWIYSISPKKVDWLEELVITRVRYLQ